MDRAGLLASRVRIDCIRIHPLAFPDSIQWPRAISSLTVARQRGTCTRFPVFAEQRRRAFQVNFKELSLLNLPTAVQEVNYGRIPAAVIIFSSG